jgi:hypothetical protein
VFSKRRLLPKKFASDTLKCVQVCVCVCVRVDIAQRPCMLAMAFHFPCKAFLNACVCACLRDWHSFEQFPCAGASVLACVICASAFCIGRVQIERVCVCVCVCVVLGGLAQPYRVDARSAAILCPMQSRSKQELTNEFLKAAFVNL